MPDEVFRRTAGVTADELVMIEHVWADVLRQNRWRRRAWRLVNRARRFPLVCLCLRLAR
ncbi:MAG: hypothetical protein ACR2JW_05890 [Thermomicrobiales bacterium]